MIDISNFCYSFRSWNSSRVIGIEGIDIGEEEEVVGSAHSSGDRREGIVVSEFVDVENFGNGDCIVFVDNWDYSE